MPDEFGGIEVDSGHDEFGGIAVEQPPQRSAPAAAPAQPEEEPGRITKMPQGAREWARFTLGGMLSPIKQAETAIEQTAIQTGLAQPGSRLSWSPSAAMEKTFFKPIPHTPKAESTLGQIGGGIADTVIDFANFMQTPEGAGSLGIARFPALLRKIILTDWLGKIATETPGQFKRGYEAAQRGDYKEAAHELSGGAGGVLLSGAIGRTMAHPDAAHPSVTLPRSLEALGEVPEYAGLGLRNIPLPEEAVLRPETAKTPEAAEMERVSQLPEGPEGEKQLVAEDISKAVDTVDVGDIATYSPVPALVEIIRRAPQDPAMKTAAEQAMQKIGQAAKEQGVGLDTIKTQLADELKAVYGKDAAEMADYYFGKPSAPTLTEQPAQISAGKETSSAPPASAQEPEPLPARPPSEPPPVQPGPEETPRSPQALGVTNPQVQAAVDALDTLRQKTVNAWRTRPIKQVAAATKDAADNQSRILGDNISKGINLQARKLFGNSAPQALDAVYPVIESGGDIARLNQFIAQSTGVAGGLRARRAAEFAAANWQRMQPLVARVKADLQDQLSREHSAGIETPERENYIPHIFDTDKLPNRGEEFFAGPGGAGGGGGRFRAARTFDTIYDAIAAGYGDAIKSLNAADITGARVRNGAKRVQDAAWADIFRSVEDPSTSAPIIADVRVDRNGQRLAPAGYELLELFPGRTVAVHKGYSAFFDALTGRSRVESFEALGLPVGRAALQTAAGIKHGMLLFDSFHASRVMQKAVFLAPKHFGPQLADIPGFAKRGRTLLEYSDRDLNEAVRQNEITREMADYARANRPTADLLIRQGLNVGQIHEALRSSIIKDIPLVGTFNRWVFEKVTRGAIMEGGLIEFERIKRNNPTWTDERVANKVVKDINVQFGNLGRQGLFTSASSRDLARLIFLAPQWVESMARSETYGAGQLAKAPFTGQFGTLGKTMATGLGAYFIGAQILNMITRGKPTWENDEEGHKLDAWIPDVTGKTPGFFLSPLSVPAELTHDALRYVHKKEGSREVAMQIARNKMSPLMRAGWTMATGRNYSDYKIGDAWETTKEAAISLAPVPIPLSGAFKGYPGQTQRQLFGSAGVKIEPAETALAQIREKATRFRKSQPDAAPDEGHFDPYADSGYSNLRLALRAKNEEQVADAIAKLRKGRSDADIQKAMLRSVKIPFTGKRSLEKQFRQSLTDKEEAIYDAAIEERLENLDLFLKIWGDRPEK